MMGYQNCFGMEQNYCWQNYCYLMMQNNIYLQQQQQMELQLRNQQLYYFPTYLQSISAIQ